MTNPVGMPELVDDRPVVSDAEAATVAERLFGIRASAVELPSERDRVFRLSGEAGTKIALRISNPAESRAVLALQHDALDRIAASQPTVAVPRPLPSVNGNRVEEIEIGGCLHLVSGMTWLDGASLARVRPRTARQLESLGELLGRIAIALDGWDPPAAHRKLKWDLGGATWIERHLDAISDPRRRQLVEQVLRSFRSTVAPIWEALPRATVHNDANDHNVLVRGCGQDSCAVGLIDFGDMLVTARVAEPAIGAAYGMIGVGDPLAAAAAVFRGFHRAYPLTDPELATAYPLICTRLAISVVNAALQRRARPGNPYLTISEDPIWELVERLAEQHPRLAEYRLRDACALPPCPASARVRRWIEEHRAEFSPVVPEGPGDSAPAPIDLSVGSAFVGPLSLLADEPKLSKAIADHLAESGTRVGVGAYNEARLAYRADQYRQAGWDGPEWRTVHIGLDLFVPAATPVRSPLAGRVHSLRLNAAPGDYGPTVVMEHQVVDDEGPLCFYTLYGHLDLDTIRTLHPGQPVRAGGVIGRVGAPAVNGGWPPHLHFQAIVDLLDRQGEFPGVARPGERAVWTSLSPDPSSLAGVAIRGASTLDGAAILDRRQRLLGPNLSVAYRTPLHIVRGWMQHLYDADGRRYLDAVNNVPHVGHSHPEVVRAAQRQMAVLNTNTRYLHETVVRYAERLTATLPDPLQVCFFVNSGSEANELALRIAWTHLASRGTVVMEAAYHGNTPTLIGLSPYKCQAQGGDGLAPYARTVPLPDPYRGLHRRDENEAGRRYARYLTEAIAELEAAGYHRPTFLVESLPSCGGQIVPPPGYLAEAYALVRAAGGLCVADEVQVGFGRVGSHMWGFETQGVVPDIVVMGKPAGNGHPLGIVVTTPQIAASFANGLEFFSTFGGNPVSAATGLAVLDVLERDRLQWRALETGNHLLARLSSLAQRHPTIGDVRGLGLFVGVELVSDRQARTPAPAIADYVVNRMRALGVLLSADGPAHNVLKIKPPLAFGPEDADELAVTLDRVLGEDGAQPDEAVAAAPSLSG